MRIVFLACSFLLSVVAGQLSAAESSGKIDFNRDIRPILSENCFQCHGPDGNQRKADLRLDTKDGLFKKLDQRLVVAAGKPADSEVYQRLTSADADLRMPPADSGKKLKPAEIDLVRRWIEQGGEWKGHWAYEPINRTPPPAIKSGNAADVVDAWILPALAKQTPAALKPSPEADRRTLIRRLSFDLTGLPPTAEEVEAFVNDTSPNAYEKVVNRLLDSPRYGERMAIWWLDLVRYADSVGYHGDQPVSVSPFREWVIDAFNRNQRFDEFTLEQIAGDLLEKPTIEQRVAAGYNRLGMMSAEGGVQDKEYRLKYAAERVRNVSGTWMGSTLGCAECHDHKYDPFKTKDFYQMAAFFADIQEKGIYGGSDFGPQFPVLTDEQTAEIARLDKEIAAAKAEYEKNSPELTAAQLLWEKKAAEPGAPEAKGIPKNILEILLLPSEKRNDGQKNQLAAHYRTIAPQLADARNKLQALEQSKAAITKNVPTMLSTTTVAPRMVRILPRGNWMDESGEIVQPGVPSFLPQPATAAGATKKDRLTRLDLARWIVSPENPLTARVLANRMWKLFFGQGLSKRLDDLGAQGEWPSHPELLDALAAQLIDNKWDLKQLVRTLVMSATYRQSSRGTPDLKERDPYNRLLARQASFRLDAEFVRDNALAISGLLVEKLGGPSVRPFQPPGYWAYLNFPKREWQNSAGQDLYRRGLYTHWQRQYLHPSLLAFDAPSREECCAERMRSNTPLQSLVLLNDPIYVEAARAFAGHIVTAGGKTPAERLDWAFRRAVARPITSDESQVLTSLLQKHLEKYKADAAGAKELLAVGGVPNPQNVDPAELAAWTSVARTILNLHETITRY